MTGSVPPKEVGTAGPGRDQAREGVSAALAYVPPLFFVPYVLKGSSEDSRFHARQAFVLLCGLLASAVAVVLSDGLFGRLLGGLVLLGWYFNLVAKIIHFPMALCAVLLYIGVSVAAAVQAAAGQTWRVPLVARFADRLRVW